MRRLVIRLLTTVQLTRLTMAFGAVSDLWFVILLARALDPEGPLSAPRHALPEALGAGAIVAVGLFAFGASLNDLLDSRHDTAFSPDRPIPAGRIKASQAVIVTIGSLLAAMVAAVFFGEAGLLLAALVAAGILFYNAAGKHIPAIGLVAIGAIHATHMFIPEPGLAFTLPVWLVATHVTGLALAIYVIEEKRPALTRRSVAALVLGYLALSSLLLGLGAWRAGAGGLWPEGRSLAGLAWPALAVVAFVAVARRKSAGVSGRVAAEKLHRYGAMWQSLYGAAWLAALGLDAPAIWLGLFAVAGFASMTIIKEINGATGRPVTFRG
ncbi:MAG TPA: hypothetical protein PKC43_08930 [Phycisphaerales bacterium]|nr:hypothetical protein [Phycisphaerales bacterium]HMP37560.1 hypothetical protein [Phycisphaerales bacterium]